MNQRQERLEEYHKLLFRHKSPFKKYTAFISFYNLRNNYHIKPMGFIGILKFVRYVFKEITYNKIYRIKSNSLWK
jgi:hypothetical protein